MLDPDPVVLHHEKSRGIAGSGQAPFPERVVSKPSFHDIDRAMNARVAPTTGGIAPARRQVIIAPAALATAYLDWMTHLSDGRALGSQRSHGVECRISRAGQADCRRSVAREANSQRSRMRRGAMSSPGEKAVKLRF